MGTKAEIGPGPARPPDGQRCRVEAEMRRTAVVMGALVAAGALAAECGPSGMGGRSTETLSSTTTAVRRSTRIGLGRRLLDAADLGPGWIDVGGSADGPGDRPDPCGDGPEAEAGFAHGDSLFVFERLVATGSASVAAEAYALVTAAFDTCHDLTIGHAGGAIAGVMTVNGPPRLGRQRRSYSMTFSADGAPVGADLVVTHAGPFALLVLYGGLGTPEPGAALAVADVAVHKVLGARPVEHPRA